MMCEENAVFIETERGFLRESAKEQAEDLASAAYAIATFEAHDQSRTQELER